MSSDKHIHEKDTKQFKSLSIQQQIHYINNVNDPQFISDYLISLLISGDENELLLAYQLSFELCENSIEKLRSDIINKIKGNINLDNNISENIINILTRKTLNDNNLNFLFKNRTDYRYRLASLKDSINTTKNNICSSFITAYYFIYAGSGDDNFYRNNVNWFSLVTQWKILMTIACIGGIHIGHHRVGLQLLRPFLINSAPPFVQGGGLLALGLIYSNYSYNGAVLSVILNSLETHLSSSTFPIRFGGCFSLGLICMGSQKVALMYWIMQSH